MSQNSKFLNDFLASIFCRKFKFKKKKDSNFFIKKFLSHWIFLKNIFIIFNKDREMIGVVGLEILN